MKAKRFLIAVAATLLLGAGALYVAGTRLTTPAYRSAGVPDPDLFATDVLIPNGKGYVAGWVARGSGRGAVLLLHAVRSSRRQMLPRALWLNRLGYTVLLIDLPAHGESLGEHITFGAHEADGVRVALAWLRRNLPGEKIGVIGSSLGAASAVLARPGSSIDALVIEAMYPTIEDATGDHMAVHAGPPGHWVAPLLLAQMKWRIGVSASQLRPIAEMPALACPVLVIGGLKDKHTPPEETRKIFAAAHEPKQLWMVDGAAHVDLYKFAGAEYEQRVGAFLEANLRPPAAPVN